MTKNRRCLCDNVKYSYCPDCSRVDRLKPSYFSQFCSEDCMTIWMTATRYNMGTLSKSEAQDIISKIDLKPIESYVSCVQRDLKVILEPEKKPSKTKKLEPVVEVEPVVIPEFVAETAPIEQPKPVAEPVATEPIHEVIKENE